MARFSKVIDIPLRMKFINYARLASVAATTASEVSRLVTQQRIERRYDADTVLYVLAAGVRIRGNPFYTVPPQGAGGVHKHRLRLEDAVGDDRLHHVELQLPRFCCERNHQVIADGFETDLVHDLWDNGIDFAGHDA